MTDESGTPPAGWYDDPAQAGRQRYWDGLAWTTDTRSAPPEMAPPVATGAARGRVPSGGWDFRWLLFEFEGRAHRAHFWGGTAVAWLGAAAITAVSSSVQDSAGGLLSLASLVWGVWTYAAVNAKRWKDRNKSGWMALIILIPLVGFLWVLIECGMLEGTRGPNEYGPDPTASV